MGWLIGICAGLIVFAVASAAREIVSAIKREGEETRRLLREALFLPLTGGGPAYLAEIESVARDFHADARL
jgi:hypothetical protein